MLTTLISLFSGVVALVDKWFSQRHENQIRKDAQNAQTVEQIKIEERTSRDCDDAVSIITNDDELCEGIFNTIRRGSGR